MLDEFWEHNIFIVYHTMTDKLPQPYPQAIIYEDSKVYACLANNPIVPWHTVVVWKKSVADLHLLSKKEYEFLMNKVDQLRNALLKTLKVKKVYLIYMDEIHHVHWHLVPRYNEKWFDILSHKPSKLTDFSLAARITKNLILDI